MKPKMPILISFVLLASLIIQRPLLAKDGKNIILVLDTSYSMVGSGGRDIMGDVKQSVNRYIDTLDEDDTVTFITFDTRVRVFPTVSITDDNAKDILKKYISMTEAKGLWTYTYKMIQAVFQKAEEISTTDTDRQMVIVVMTDGIDDPPPGYRKEQQKIDDIATRYQDKDWWMYFVNFQDLKKGAKAEKLKADLAKVSEHISVITNPEPGKAMGEELESEIRKDEWSVWRYWAFLVAFLVAAAVIFLIIMARRAAQLKVTGRLEYWNNDLLNPYIERFDMTSYASRIIVVGKGVGCHLNIREFESRKPFAFKAIRVADEIKIALEYDSDVQIEFRNREKGDMLEDGDIFTVSNYSFKYMK